MGRIKKFLISALVVAAIAPVAGVAAPDAGAKRQGAAAGSRQTSAPVDVNRAGVEELASIKGIGPQLASRIVAYRKEHGRFESIDDLLAVKGIGPKLLSRIRNRVTVGGRGARR